MHEGLQRKHLILALLVAACALPPGIARAQEALPAPLTALRPEQALQTPPGRFIQDLGNQAIGIITDRNLAEQQRTDRYHDILRSAFDLKTVGRFVLGRAWNTASPEQQQEYMRLFEEMVIRIYGDRLKFYSGENFRVRSVRQESERDFIVDSEIAHPGSAQPTTVDWRVRQEDGKLAIIDVVIDGVSQSVTERQEFASIIQRDNGKLDKLLAYMRERVQQPDTGSSR